MKTDSQLLPSPARERPGRGGIEGAQNEPAPALAPSDQQRTLVAATERYFRQHASHRYFVTVDKPLYRPGETIWFRAFELSTPDLTADRDGQGASAKLLSPQGSVVATKRVRMSSGAIANDFPLAGSLAGGEYKLRIRAPGGTVERSVMVSAYEPPQIQKRLEFLRKAYGPGDQVAATLAFERATGEPLAGADLVGLVTVDGTEVAREPIVTDADGVAEISFPLSDSITSFRAIAEGVSRGGLPGRGEARIRSVLPVSLHARLPLEVSEGDIIELPISIANESDREQSAVLTADFGPAFTVERGLPERGLVVPAGERRSLFAELRVGAVPESTEAAGRAHIKLRAAGFTDELERELRVVPRGFPQQTSLAGTVSGDAPARHEIDLADATANSVRAQVSLYPSPLATMVGGAEAIIREPTGCFEQASSANYPNIIVLSYLEEHGGAAPQLVERTQGMLERGYDRLTGYESSTRGYEWFGGDPGHEALTAYGLLQFRDMAAVYGDVDPTMMQRTRRWLLSRRDGEGGFLRNARALDSFGRASDEVTNGYITYALAEAGEKDLAAELAYQRRIARATRDPYLMALASHVLLELSPQSDDAARAVSKLAGMQSSDGSFPGADHSVTRSGGNALAIETTSLAAMALLKAGDDQLARVRRAVDWINDNRSGFGGYGSTQSTVLALKTLSRYAERTRAIRADGAVSVLINGRKIGDVSFEAGQREPIEIGELADALNPGRNVIEIQLDSETTLPYSVAIEYTSPRPASSPDAPVAVSTSLATDEVPLGEGVRMNVEVHNTAGEGLPMALARVGIPGGLSFQTWQLEELVDRGTIDFFETREREVVLYFRSLAPDATHEIALELIAAVPGRYEGPASRAYLYYTDELVRWEDPVSVRILP